MQELLLRVTTELADVRCQIHQPVPSVLPVPPVNPGHSAPPRTLAKCKVNYDCKDPSRVAAFLRQVEDYRIAEEVSEAAALRSVALI